MNKSNICITLLLFSILAFAMLSFKQSAEISSDLASANAENTDPPFMNSGKTWVDSVMKTLSAEQRIAQLFMVAAYSNKSKAHEDEMLKLIKEQHIGGLIFMQGGPVRQANLTNTYQKAAKIPLMIAIDGEWGLSMRLDSTFSFPKQMTLGAIQNDTLIYMMGAEIAKHCRRMGIHVNFAPVVDVNNNASNPVINMRSFGENKYNVARKGLAYMKGMQDFNVMANAKHFPGHGDTDTDSHKALPVIKHSRARIDSLELYPFAQMINAGLASMMVAHLFIPSLDNMANTATTLSKKVVDGLLKDSLGFKGLIFTDALNMKGVSAFNSPGYVDVKALMAGNDIMLFSENVPVAINEIKKAIAKGDITQDEIDQRCRKILHAKHWLGLNELKAVSTKNLHTDLNPSSSTLLLRKLTEASLTLTHNKNGMIPFKGLDTLKIASLVIDDKLNNVFQKNLSLYAPIKKMNVSRDELIAKQGQLIKELSEYNAVIVSVHNTKRSMSKNAGINSQINSFMRSLNAKTNTTLVLFANPYSLEKLDTLGVPKALLVAYEDREISQELAAQALFGAFKINGKLPVSAGPSFISGMGEAIGEAIRLKYTIPEELGINAAKLNKIDTIAINAIKQKATPGCQILIAKDGKVFYHKAFGHQTYDKKKEVELSDLYDLASITKIAASTLAIMKMADDEFIVLDKKIADYIPIFAGTDKGEIRIRDLLAHQAGLVAWIPFYKRTIASDEIKKKYYRSEPDEEFSLKVAENMYLRKDYPDSMLMVIAGSTLNPKREYKYSDLGYYFFKYIIEHHTQIGFDQYLHNNFYAPLGLHRMTFNPRDKFELNEIIPTEKDDTFRKQLIHGYVHDQGAAMLGGVAGHAGLFSNASDLAVIMQMLLNKGNYGGKAYINKATIEEFTRCQFCEFKNRRGLGFDKPEMDYKKIGPTCKCVSALSFGHTGFTGTMTWADPEKNLIYIFLSNRVNPDAENKKLNSLNVRPRIQEAIYELI
jgi:beta-glucosidase-like glycosyl hydrolase/CubicO group peptidase (beta-lactamase class C family)